jgi:hypothetical protein
MQSIDRKLARVAREIAAERKPTMAEACEAFLLNTSVRLPDGTHTFLTEADCRQIKGAAKPVGREVAPSGRLADAAPPKSRVDEFCAEHAGPAPFKRGDKVTYRPEVDWPGQVRTVASVKHEAGQWVVYYADEGYSHDSASNLELLPQQQEGDWIEWKGGSAYPEALLGVNFDIRFRCGEVRKNKTLRDIQSWAIPYIAPDYTVVAYRVIA